MFHEIDVDKIDRPRGMDITVVTTATNNEEGRALLKHLASRSRRTEPMAKKALVNKANKKPKFAVRAYTRCQRCAPALGLPQVRTLPHLPSRDGTPRRTSGSSQELLVT